MKFIAVSNFKDKKVSDKLIEEGLSIEEAQLKAAEQNLRSGPMDKWFYRAVPDSYKLYKVKKARKRGEKK